MKYIRKLPDALEFREKFPLSEDEKKRRTLRIEEIQNILMGIDNRKIVIVGPCSADREDSVLEYSLRLAKLNENIKDKLLIIPRIYTSKPRTTGTGYKGMLHNPYGNDDEDLFKGVISARHMHIAVIRETGLFAADEMLYPEEMHYLSDALCYIAVGARSVEDQGHRMLASDSGIPVGLKNPTGGSKISLINSIKAAQTAHRLVYRGWEVETDGNIHAHAILRGYANNNGINCPNYHYEDVVELYDMCLKNRILNPGVIIDCNHSNSGKKYDAQPRIVREIMGFCKEDINIDGFVKGIMVESYLEDGSQMVGNGVWGKSITDPCLGWRKTEKLLYEMADF